MVLGAKARAILQGRFHVSQEDIRAVAAPVLRHRIKTNFNADAEGVTVDEIVRRLIDTVPSSGEPEEDGGRTSQVFRSADAR
jgi:MoxR-like ATPase